MSKKGSYESYLEQETWSLKEAVKLVTGVLDNPESTRTYKKALEAIKNKTLEAKVCEEDFEYHIKPYNFIKWCNEGQIHVDPELNKFFNYDYWLMHRKYWSFHEAVMIILSKDVPPLPHEIENVFEKDDEHHYFATKLKQLMDDWSNQIFCYEWNSGNPVEIQFSSTFYSINNVCFEKKNLLLEIKKEVNFLEEGIKNNKFKIVSKVVDNYASELVKEEEDRESYFKAAIKKIDSEDGEKIYNKSLKDWSTEKRILALAECLNLLAGINQYFFGYWVEESAIVSEIEHYFNSERFAWLSERYRNKFLYQEMLFDSFEAGEIKFVRDLKIDAEARKLSGQVNVKDFLQWTESHQIKRFECNSKLSEKIIELCANSPEDRLTEFVGKRKVDGQKYTEVNNEENRKEIGCDDAQRFESLIDDLESKGLIKKGSTEVSGRFQRFRLELTNDGWKRFDELCNNRETIVSADNIPELEDGVIILQDCLDDEEKEDEKNNGPKKNNRVLTRLIDALMKRYGRFGEKEANWDAIVRAIGGCDRDEKEDKITVLIDNAEQYVFSFLSISEDKLKITWKGYSKKAKTTKELSYSREQFFDNHKKILERNGKIS